MKLKYIIASFIAAASVLVGCVKENPVSSLEGLSVSNDYVTLAADEGASLSITVTADEAWTASLADSKVDWLTLSPASGSAGKDTPLVFTAKASSAARGAEVFIDMGGKRKIVKVNQAAPAGVEVPLATCEEVINGPDVTYKVRGTCVRVANTSYGNWYLADETGEVYIYGTFNAKGQYPKDADGGWAGFGIEVGDIVTVEGPKTVYNGTVELVDVSIVKVEKSLIQVEDFDFEKLPPEDTTFNMVVTAKESPLLINSDADWLQVESVNADGSYKLHADANVRTAERTANISISGPTARKSVAITQKGVPSTGASVSEIISMDDDSQVQTLPSTVVVALTTRGAVLSDGTKALYAFGDKAAALKVGDGVQMSARKTTYNGVPELTDITAVFVDSEGNAVNHPEAKDITAEAGTYAAAEAEYVKLTGILSVSTSGDKVFYNMALDEFPEGDKQGSIVYPVDDLNAKSFDGKKITVTGYFNGLSSQGKFVNVIATRIVEFVDNPKGTLRNPYGADELAAALLSGETFEDEVYARGIINKIDNVNTSYGNAQYWLSDDGTAATLEVYRGFWYNGDKFTSEDQIAVGDEVVVCGKVKVYNGTPEFDANNRIVTLNGKAAPSGDGTADNPYNVTKLAEMLLAGETIDGEVYAKGLISQIDNVNLQFGNAQYWISDDGGKLFQMEIYRGFWFGGEKFTSEDQIALGDEVVVYGKVKVYNGTPEFDANNKIISLNGKTE